jgi:hypothetical protein
VTFALNEIINGVLTTTNPAFETLWIKNPVSNMIEINTSYSIDNANISVTDMLGKTIYTTQNQTISGSLEIPIALNKGVYIITIGNENGSVNKKIVKE